MPSIEKEIHKCFMENPDLYKKSPRHLAEWFFLQGQIAMGPQFDMIEAKTRLYRRYLSLVSPELLEQAEEEIKKALEL